MQNRIKQIEIEQEIAEKTRLEEERQAELQHIADLKHEAEQQRLAIEQEQLESQKAIIVEQEKKMCELIDSSSTNSLNSMNPVRQIQKISNQTSPSNSTATHEQQRRHEPSIISKAILKHIVQTEVEKEEICMIQNEKEQEELRLKQVQEQDVTFVIYNICEYRLRHKLRRYDYSMNWI